MSQFDPACPPPLPNIIDRGINFANAVIEHIKKGMTYTTEEQKALRFHICSSNKCGYYKSHGDNGICLHRNCGCYIRQNGTVMDKLLWAESKCPVGLWGPIEGKSPENPENGV